MAELADFVRGNAAKIDSLILKRVYKKLPMLKLEFAQLHAPSFPHLVPQLQMLANLVEDFVDGKAEEIPLVTVAGACFAIIYAQRQWDLIPDPIKDLGRTDDSGVVRVVLIENERTLSAYAEKIGLSWKTITVEP
ncbi:MAG TPA: hypothetical protein VM735_06885 [Candidatus Kapabacteria bacterium]|nr:hypothetical protein [Candidatus Kapabacteria bacterium]